MNNKLAVKISDMLRTMNPARTILNPSILRLRPGRNQRSAAAWSWCLCENGVPLDIGSQDKASDVAKGFVIRKYCGSLCLDAINGE